MRLPIIAVTILMLISIGIDTYIYFAIRRLTRRKVAVITHLSISTLLILMLITILFLPIRTGSDTILQSVMWILYTYLAFYAPKLIFVIFDLLSLIPRLRNKRNNKKLISSKWRIISYIGAFIAVLVFGTMWWGALINRHNININKVDVYIDNLPAKFEGFTIAQISDLHVGSYGNDTTFISRLVDEINAQNPDMIVFTGDIVNRFTDELLPFVPTLSRLKAPNGVYSILGNHDYGDYVDWKHPEEKSANLEMLKTLQKEIGWQLLNNDHKYIVKQTDTLVVIGVENVGDPPFHTYGDLSQAYPTLDDSLTKILLSHNPAHWHNDIASHSRTNIALTLSGHTHAMQIEALGLSPAAWRYDEWGGLYDDKAGHLLNVNIGIGTVAIPARIGATPEVSLITLHRK